VEALHRLAQRRLTLTVLAFGPGEHCGDFAPMLFGLTGFDDDALFQDAIVNATGPRGNRYASRGDCF
jgi:hypothetical protein